MPIAVDAAAPDTPRMPLKLAPKPLQQLDRSLCEIEHRSVFEQDGSEPLQGAM